MYPTPYINASPSPTLRTILSLFPSGVLLAVAGRLKLSLGHPSRVLQPWAVPLDEKELSGHKGFRHFRGPYQGTSTRWSLNDFPNLQR